MLKVLGINNDVTTCECCGKANLKLTVVLGDEYGERHYGRDCAAKAMYPTTTAYGNVVARISALRMQRIAEREQYQKDRFAN